jgi:hypothetical protein
MASETAFSQINSGFHSRHAPCGMSIDMSIRSPIRQGSALASPRPHPSAGTTVQIIQVSASRASAPPPGERSHGDIGAIKTRLLTTDRRQAAVSVSILWLNCRVWSGSGGWTRSEVSPLDHNLDEAGNGSHVRPQLGIRSDDGAVACGSIGYSPHRESAPKYKRTHASPCGVPLLPESAYAFPAMAVRTLSRVSSGVLPSV